MGYLNRKSGFLDPEINIQKDFGPMKISRI